VASFVAERLFIICQRTAACEAQRRRWLLNHLFERGREGLNKLRPLHNDSLDYRMILTFDKGPSAMTTTPVFTLTITLEDKEAKLIEKVARFRQGQFNGQGAVDLGAYIRALVDRDVAACVQEIKGRQNA